MKIREMASSTLGMLPKQQGERPVQPQESGPTIPAHDGARIRPAQLSRMLAGLESREREARIHSAMVFLRNYDSVVQAVTAAPLLSVTSVKKKLFNALSTDAAQIIEKMRLMKMRKELELLSKLREIPPGARALALAALAPSAAPASRATQPTPHIQIPGETKKAKQVPAAPPAPQAAPAPLDSKAMGALISGLSATQPEKAAAAAVECLMKFDAITDFLSKSPSPIITATEFTTKLFGAVSANADAVLGILKKGRERRALEVLSSHPAAPLALRKRAGSLLQFLKGAGNQ
jgi:hypothetical protein